MGIFSLQGTLENERAAHNRTKIKLVEVNHFQQKLIKHQQNINLIEGGGDNLLFSMDLNL